MNRADRRRYAKKAKTDKPKYSLEEVQRAMGIAMRMNSATKGHLYKKEMKDLCVFCGATMKTRKKCEYWFLTFTDRLQVILINPDFYQDDDDNAKWVMNGPEYEKVRVIYAKDK